MDAFLVGLLDHVAPIVISLTAVALVAFIRGFLKKHEGKIDAEVKELGERLLVDLVQQGATYSEQWAYNQSKKLAENQKISGDEKLIKAVEYVANEMKRHKLPQLAEKEIADKVESVLGISTLNNNTMPALPELPDEEGDDNDDNEKFGLR